MYALISSPESQGWMFWTRFLFLMELMVEHVYRGIQFGLMMLFVGACLVVWVMVNPTYSDCDPVWMLYVDDGQSSHNVLFPGINSIQIV